jgi:hypothetical protein
MKTRAQSAKQASPYSAPLCVLMLLLTGMIAKFGGAFHLLHLH